MRRDGATYTYGFDAQKNSRQLTDDAGQVTDTYRYDAWGTELARTGTTENPYRFGGQVGYQSSVAGDMHVRARVLEPQIARWTSPDPIRFADGLNPYVYAGNGPVSYVDPTGLIRCPDLCMPDGCLKNDSFTGFGFAPAIKRLGPCEQEAAASILDRTDYLSKIAGLANLAKGAVVSLREVVGTLTPEVVGQLQNTDTNKAVKGAVDKLSQKLQRLEGISIWVRFDAERCVSQPCYIAYRRLAFEDGAHCFRCTESGRGREIGFAASDVGGITRALPRCIRQAERHLTRNRCK